MDPTASSTQDNSQDSTQEDKPNLKAIPKTVNDIKFQETSMDIWESKYCLKTKQGERVDQNIDETYKRVALALSDVELEPKRQEWNEKFLWALRHGVIPAGRIISSCRFVIGH